jgi:GDP-mannose 6-dehydrogenase
MKIAVFGLGYVGTVSAACFAARGHDVVGVDVEPGKAAAISAGRSPIVEPGLDRLVADVVSTGRLRATTNAAEAVALTEISFVCVGTPSRENGSLNLDFVERVVTDIATGLRERTGYHVVVIRSTVLPGTVDERLMPILERTVGRKPGDGYGLAMNPEFLREGSSIVDFNEPPKIVIGEVDARSGEAVARAYAGIDAPVVRTSIRIAEMV